MLPSPWFLSGTLASSAMMTNGDFPFDPAMAFAHRVSRYANPAPSDFWVFWWDFGVWEAFQRTGNGCGIQIDKFSNQTESYSSICKNFDDFVQFGIDSSDLGTAWKGLETASGVLSLARSKANESRMAEACLASCKLGAFPGFGPGRALG